MIDKNLKFPSGRTVARVKQDATTLKNKEGIKHREALNIVAKENGFPNGWQEAINYFKDY